MSAAADAFHRRRSPERGGVDDDPQILNYLGRYEVGLLGVDDNPQFLTKLEDSLQILKERLPRGRLDQPVVEVSTHTDTQRRSIAETGAMTLVKTCGAVERPKHRALNW